MSTPTPIVTASPDRLSGAVVFAGTRVPVQTLMDYLEGGFVGRIPDGFPERFTGTCHRRVGACQDGPAGNCRCCLTRASGKHAHPARCVPRRLADALPPHDVRSAPEFGWGDLDDGPLLDAMAGQFDLLITEDKGLPKQQRLDHRPFAVVVLRARTNRLVDVLPLVPTLLSAIPELGPGQARDTFR